MQMTFQAIRPASRDLGRERGSGFESRDISTLDLQEIAGFVARRTLQDYAHPGLQV